MNRLILAAVLLGLGGCTQLYDAYGGRSGYPDRSSRYPDGSSDRYDDYSRTPEYRRVTSDAAAYARRVDGALRIGSGQERRIRDLLTDRTARLLQQTRVRDHSRVYPFPRWSQSDSRTVRDFWARADRDIERVLGRRDADAYRRYVRAGGLYRDDRDDRYRDDRYDDRGGYDDGERGRVRGDHERSDDRRPGPDRGSDRDRDRGPDRDRDGGPGRRN